MSEGLTDIAEQIIAYQKKHDKTDAQMAFDSRLSVEKYHTIKSGEAKPTPDELAALERVLSK
ncbi:LBP_cg2779 family protein [Levilactobacillus bambusae]|uniref:XRE family transcriptional regulator n=1 Tax=Levilactobacillus bambusae TaxID=2024736 RepID=A0A2V1N192_9LACO|nr:LBP_cg2779 family protein [Levilactobacillus bambusae]PWG00080.1 hypothetical protein DCM90_03855 [Levilactobacillus bambusae]